MLQTKLTQRLGVRDARECPERHQPASLSSSLLGEFLKLVMVRLAKGTSVREERALEQATAALLGRGTALIRGIEAGR